MQEAYILVKDIGISYSDLQKMTRYERIAFLNLKAEEDQRYLNEIERDDSSR